MTPFTPLTPEQVEHFKTKQVEKGRPVRFLHNGRSCAIVTGETLPGGTNVIYQFVYWHFTEETAIDIARITGTKPVFDKE